MVIPVLREAGFKGSFPDFRRFTPDRIDLITFKFDRSGGGLFVEVSQCGVRGTTTRNGDVVEPRAVKVWDMQHGQIFRLQNPGGWDEDTWLRFDSGQFAHCARQVLECLPKAEEWWKGNSTLNQLLEPTQTAEPPLAAPAKR